MLAYQGFGNQKRDLWQRAIVQVPVIIILRVHEPRLILPLFEKDEDVEILQGCAGAEPEVIALPRDMMLIQQVYNGWPVEAAAISCVGGVTASSAGHESKTIGIGWSQQRTEII